MNGRIAPLFVGLASVALSASGASCQSDPQPSAIAARIDAVIRPEAAAGRFAGTVLVGQSGRVLFERSYGAANVEMGAPATNETRYRIFSITKQFTAMAVMVLAERGSLDLRASVRRYLPELPRSWQGATIGQMLTHTSGIPNEEQRWAAAFEDTTESAQLDALARLSPQLTRDSLESPPGTKWQYNNFAYDLLACVIERVAHVPFATFVHDHIFTPAGMRGAGFDVQGRTEGGKYLGSAVVSHLASGYNGSPDSLQAAVSYMFESLGAGGVYATAEDLLRYDAALANGAIVSAKTVSEMIDRAVPVNSRVSYGYGWMVSRRADGSLLVHHSGGNNGYVSDFARYPAAGVCIVVLSNRGFTDTTPLRDRIAAVVVADASRAAP